jgi:4'-phosphopantetheinyl transferase
LPTKLDPSEVRVWLVSLDVAPGRRAALERLLSPDERERADRYLVPAPRERFVVARGTLREILGRHTGRPPEQLRFSYPCVCGQADCMPSRRKPRLELEDGVPPLRFNLSHTDGLAMIAVSIGRELGIDVERVAHRPEAFYRSWTRTEAHAKARGTGLGPSNDLEAGRWWLGDLPAPPGYLASLAVEGAECSVETGWWRC